MIIESEADFRPFLERTYAELSAGPHGTVVHVSPRRIVELARQYMGSELVDWKYSKHVVDFIEGKFGHREAREAKLRLERLNSGL